MSFRNVLVTGFAAAVIASGAPAMQPASAGTCGSPVVIWFYAGASVPGAPNGRVIAPVRTDPGADACAMGIPHDAFYVTPGASFVIAQLNRAVSNAPQACFTGLVTKCDPSKLVAGPNGTTYAQTEIYPLNPTSLGTITASFVPHGAQTYRTVV